MFMGRYIGSSLENPWVPTTDLHCHQILIRREGAEWSSQPAESRMVASASLSFLLLLFLHLASSAPAPAEEVKEVHSPALGEVVQVAVEVICILITLSLLILPGGASSNAGWKQE